MWLGQSDGSFDSRFTGIVEDQVLNAFDDTCVLHNASSYEGLRNTPAQDASTIAGQNLKIGT